MSETSTSEAVRGTAGEVRAWLGFLFENAARALVVVDERGAVRCANALADALMPGGAGPAGGPAGGQDFGGHLLDWLGAARVTREVALVAPWGEPLTVVELTEASDPPHPLELTHDHFRSVIEDLPGATLLVWDTDLRLVIAAGGSLRRVGYDAKAMIGKCPAEVFSAQAWNGLEPVFTSTLNGGPPDQVDYLSADSQVEYRMRFRPLTGADGATVIGGLAVSQEVSEQRSRQHLLEQIQRLSHVGSYTYDRIHGWRADEELLSLLGVDSVDGIGRSFEVLVVAEDADAVRDAIDEVVDHGGRATVRYRIVHGHSLQVRHMVGTFMGVVGFDGSMLRLITTHVDVTAAVWAAQARVRAAQARTVLLRRVSDTLAGTDGPTEAQIKRITDVAVAATGDGAVVQIFGSDGGVEFDVLSVTAEPRDSRITDELIEAMRSPVSAAAAHQATSMWSTVDNPHWRSELTRMTGHQVPADVAHVISAPVRHTGVTLGYLRIFRLEPTNPFQSGDDDLVQMIADRIGAVVAEHRVRDELRRQYEQGEALTAQLQRLTAEQRELLDQLSGVEERERALLAEAIHDEPLQLILTVMMQMDRLSTGRSNQQSELFEPMLTTLETAVDKLRTLIIALTPPDLTDGLGGALRRLAEGIFIGQSTRIVTSGRAHVSLTPLRKINAYNILREAMVNVRKHARAGTVTISLEEADGTVTASVTDDGSEPTASTPVRGTWGWPPCTRAPSPRAASCTSPAPPVTEPRSCSRCLSTHRTVPTRGPTTRSPARRPRPMCPPTHRTAPDRTVGFDAATDVDIGPVHDAARNSRPGVPSTRSRDPKEQVRRHAHGPGQRRSRSHRRPHRWRRPPAGAEPARTVRPAEHTVATGNRRWAANHPRSASAGTR